MTVHTSIETGENNYYWKSAAAAQTDEVHVALLQATADRSDLDYFVAQVFSTPDAIPLGYINLALDRHAREVCALYEVPLGMEDCVTQPTWFPASDDTEDSVAAFADKLDSYGAL